MPMRRLVITLLCGLLVAPAAAFAASHAVGDGVLELRAVAGTVVIGRDLPARGTLWGQMDKGTLRVTDPVYGDGQILVSGYERKWTIPPATIDGPVVTAYWGKNLHFRVTGGKYKLGFSGAGIDLTAVGIGVALLDGDETVDDAGDYAVDGGKWNAVPVFSLPKQFRAVAFGDQPPAQTP
jgi:hypothetical protein